MPASLANVGPNTPMGANLVPGGAVFRVWAPAATAVYALGDFNQRQIAEDSLLNRDSGGYWSGFIPGAAEFHRYIYHVIGTGSAGPKRDPYARELTADWPNPDCILRKPDYPWSPTDFRMQPFHRLVIHQLHVGTFDAPRWPKQAGTFLDVALRVEYFTDLGVNVLQLLPIVEFRTRFSMGYNGTDYFSPEMDYEVPDADLAPYRTEIDRLLAAKGLPATGADDLRGEVNQLKALINLCHLYDIAVILDVVYNHAGGDFGEQSLFFFDRQPMGDLNRSQYFTNVGHAGGLVFAFWKQEVRRFLVDNALFFLSEYRVDGFRYDQVSVIVADNVNDGWPFCQALTDTCKFVRPGGLHHAEYWPVNPAIVQGTSAGGAGFDCTLHDGLRDTIRRAVAQASFPGEGPVNLDDVAASLRAAGFRAAWRAVQGVENHDVVYRERATRIPVLADSSNPRSWFARSRSRVALGLILTAPGIPMLFMGQEFLEMRQWADDLENFAGLRPDWAAFATDKTMRGFYAFTRDLIRFRLAEDGLTGEGFRVVHVHNGNRVIVFHRWVPGVGRDVLVAASLSNRTLFNYRIGFPGFGAWRERFNSDFYDQAPNPNAIGNGGNVFAGDGAMHGFAQSASVTLPANGLLVFTR